MNQIDNTLTITDKLTLRLIENKRIKSCIECKRLCNIGKVRICTLYPAMTDMVECYKFTPIVIFDDHTL